MATAALSPDKPRGLFGKAIMGEEGRQLVNWLLVWVALANAGFMPLWLIGAPPRWPEILLTGAVGLVVRHRSRPVRFAAFFAVTSYSLLSFVAGLFNLAITSLLHSLKFLIEMNPAQSVEYLVGAAVIALLMGVAWLALRRPQGFVSTAPLLVAIIAVALLATLDWTMGRGMRGHYNRAAAAGAPFSSAVERSGFGAATGTPRNLMVVIVESLGQPVGNAEMERLLFARYRQPDVARRFALETGTTTYYGSTTSGEVRELCGRWGDYYDLLDRRDDACLPAQLRRKGYETSAYHSFTGDFFERSTWYPHIGFDRRVFAEELVGEGLGECGGVFPGACDRDVPRVLAARLKQASRPQFVYWLTLNSHLPVPPGENLDVELCARISPRLAAEYPMICRQFAIWHDIDAALAREITAPDFPPTDILIVGDHMPPYFDRHDRSQFAPDRVPWLLLRWKDDAGHA
jgi:Flp pilus assembly pilin Flp